jgi:hypothetical protein
MPTFIAGLFALYLILAAIKQFGRLRPATAAKLARHGGAAVGVLAILLLFLRGSFGLVGVLASVVASLTGFGRGNPFANAFRNASAFRAAGSRPRPGRVSTARTATIEMRLDLDSGAMSGSVLAGRYQGRALETLARPDCLDLYRECSRDDPEGATLLETYLDRRFAGWRQADQGQSDARSARGSGALTRDEAYEVLGLAPGAGADDIVRAHRSLMKKLHPDHGGSTALAARVNQAKDVLLNRHG